MTAPGRLAEAGGWALLQLSYSDRLRVAMLIPEYMSDHGRVEDYPIVTSLKDRGLFRVLHPQESIGKEETEELAKALAEVIASGDLDHLTKESREVDDQSSFGSLSMSRLGYYDDKGLAESIVQELKSRGLARETEDGWEYPNWESCHLCPTCLPTVGLESITGPLRKVPMFYAWSGTGRR